MHTKPLITRALKSAFFGGDPASAVIRRARAGWRAIAFVTVRGDTLSKVQKHDGPVQSAPTPVDLADRYRHAWVCDRNALRTSRGLAGMDIVPGNRGIRRPLVVRFDRWAVYSLPGMAQK